MNRKKIVAEFGLIGLLILAVGTSCSLEDPDPSTNALFSPFPDVGPASRTMEASLKAQRLFSEQGAPSGVVKLITFHEDTERHCSGFMISANRVVTNGHCLPEEIRFPGASCPKTYVIGQTRVGNAQQRAQCSRVVTARTFDSLLMLEDYAVIELSSPLAGVPFQTDYEGIDGHNLTAWTLTRVDDERTRIDFKQCQVVPNFIYNLYHDSKHSPSATIKCSDEIVSGNSGSILMKGGKAVGIVSHQFSTKHLPIDDKRSIFGLATNLFCIRNLETTPTPLQKAPCNLGENERNQAISEKLFGPLGSLPEILTQYLHADLLQSFKFERLEFHSFLKDLNRSEKNEPLSSTIVPSCYRRDRRNELATLMPADIDLVTLNWGATVDDLSEDGSLPFPLRPSAITAPVRMMLFPSQENGGKLRVSLDRFGEKAQYEIPACP